jgi:hypothetical protein
VPAEGGRGFVAGETPALPELLFCVERSRVAKKNSVIPAKAGIQSFQTSNFKALALVKTRGFHLCEKVFSGFPLSRE